MDPTCILMREEIATVLKDLKNRCRRSYQSRRNRIIFRLSCCCGLRRKEIIGLNLSDVLTGGPRPCIRIRQGITKGRQGKRKARKVPLWHDSATLAEIADWKRVREQMGAGAEDPLVCCITGRSVGRRIDSRAMSRAWNTAIRALGKDRVRQVSIHKGRHTCASHLHAAGYSLATIRDWLGHRNISVTNVYVHAIEEEIRDVFAQPTVTRAPRKKREPCPESPSSNIPTTT